MTRLRRKLRKLRRDPRAFLRDSKNPILRRFVVDEAPAPVHPESDEESRWRLSHQIFENYFSYLGDHVPIHRKWSIAEIGVGKWGFGRFYARKFEQVFGVDIEDHSARHPGVEFVFSDGRDVPLPSGCVHLVVSHSTLEHVRDLGRTLTEINRILKPGGWVFLTVNPLYFSPFGAHAYSDGHRVENWEHLDPKSPLFLTRGEERHNGDYLNHLTSSTFLSAVGRQPWSIRC